MFALRHDGVSLPILAELFEQIDRTKFERELTRAIKSTPRGQYHLRLWFLYEWITGRELPLEDLKTGNYVPLLDPDEYFIGAERRAPRYRIIDNLPGNRDFCPIVRRSEELATRSASALRTKLDTLVQSYDAELIGRALHYLFTKETSSSFAIEREQPSPKRAERFVEVLKRAGSLTDISERTLTEIQNRIVDPRYAEDGYRQRQNYVGESVGLTRQIVHYVPPKPGDVPSMMRGLQQAVEMHTAHVSNPVVWAACISFGFVFIHPFEDGNGRLHRFLIHHVLARTQLTPPKLIVPVSAVMLSRRDDYDATLERFSRPVLALVDYELDDDGRMSVENDTTRYYRYFDATPMAEALYRWIEQAIETDLRDELDFLSGLRRARATMRELVDMPDHRADLFVKIVHSNGGTLSKRKREEFNELTDDEVAALEAAVRASMLR